MQVSKDTFLTTTIYLCCLRLKMNNQMKPAGSRIRLEQQNRANKWIHLLGSCCCCPWIVQLAHQHQTMTPLIKGTFSFCLFYVTMKKRNRVYFEEKVFRPINR